jgi:hypothetical protein
VHVLLAAAILTIRIFNYAAVPAAELDAARRNADRIFATAGIPIAWIECRVPGGSAGEACVEPLRDTGEFVLRLQRSSNPPTTGPVSLGASLLNKEAATGVLITVDPFLAGAIARQAGVEESQVLGRAVAHEIGHLLIGTPRHAHSGLMRAYWSQEELRLNRPADWRFSADEKALMHRTLARTLRASR